MDNPIQKYLIERGVWEPRMALKEGEKDAILDDHERLARVAGLFDTYKDALAWLIQEKCKRLALDIVRDVAPAEVVIYRQALVELASLWDDAEKYSLEYAKQTKETEESRNELGTDEHPTIEDNVPDNGSA